MRYQRLHFPQDLSFLWEWCPSVLFLDTKKSEHYPQQQLTGRSMLYYMRIEARMHASRFWHYCSNHSSACFPVRNLDWKHLFLADTLYIYFTKKIFRTKPTLNFNRCEQKLSSDRQYQAHIKLLNLSYWPYLGWTLSEEGECWMICHSKLVMTSDLLSSLSHWEEPRSEGTSVPKICKERKLLYALNFYSIKLRCSSMKGIPTYNKIHRLDAAHKWILRKNGWERLNVMSQEKFRVR